MAATVAPRWSILLKLVRWLAVLPAVVLTLVLSFFPADYLYSLTDDSEVVAWAVIGLGCAVAVYIGAWLAPTKRKWPVVLIAGLLAVLPVLVLLDDPEFKLQVLQVETGIALGAWLSWRRRPSYQPKPAELGKGLVLRYRGTAPFQRDEIDRTTFFGRDDEIRTLLNMVLAERLVVLFGKSGMGKSSLINAGLVEPLARQGFLPVTVRLADSGAGLARGVLDQVRFAAQ
jgi:hypothetical protein